MCLLIYLSFKIHVDVIYGGILMPSNIVYQQDKKKKCHKKLGTWKLVLWYPESFMYGMNLRY